MHKSELGSLTAIATSTQMRAPSWFQSLLHTSSSSPQFFQSQGLTAAPAAAPFAAAPSDAPSGAPSGVARSLLLALVSVSDASS